MGLLYLLLASVVAATIIAMFFSASSNYLDGNINETLDIAGHIKLKGTFTDDDRKINNEILRTQLGFMPKFMTILSEINRKKRNNKKVETDDNNMEVIPPVVSVTDAY